MGKQDVQAEKVYCDLSREKQQLRKRTNNERQRNDLNSYSTDNQDHLNILQLLQ